MERIENFFRRHPISPAALILSCLAALFLGYQLGFYQGGEYAVSQLPIQLSAAPTEEASAPSPPPVYAEGSDSQGSAPSMSASGKININTASAEELMELDGIGPALAEAICDYRTQNGQFTKPEEIMSVPGIGQKRYEKMAHQITIDG